MELRDQSISAQVSMGPSGSDLGSEEPWRIFSISAPLCALTSLVGFDYLWNPPEGPGFAARGCVFSIRAEGPGRFDEVTRQAEEVWQKFDLEPVRSRGDAALKFLGGFSFAERDESEDWGDFDDANFWLPKLTYTREGDCGRLSLFAKASESESALRQLEQARVELERGRASEPATQTSPTQSTEVSPSSWAKHIQRIKQKISAGVIDKAVAARRSDLKFDAAIRPERVVEQLQTLFPGCFQFALRSSESVFVGASPERLVRKVDLQVWSEALAGTIDPHGENTEALLLASTKDRDEQDFVVKAIEEALAPKCASLNVAATPALKRLDNVMHLATTIEGTLQKPVHVLSLVEALHPTPAVGGVPRSAALELIRSCETRGRGWYAAPVGWFDSRGDGEFCVAIRSALIRDQSAHLYAGAGIVAASESESEYLETELKQRALWNAIELSCETPSA